MATIFLGAGSNRIENECTFRERVHFPSLDEFDRVLAGLFGAHENFLLV